MCVQQIASGIIREINMGKTTDDVQPQPVFRSRTLKLIPGIKRRGTYLDKRMKVASRSFINILSRDGRGGTHKPFPLEYLFAEIVRKLREQAQDTLPFFPRMPETDEGGQLVVLMRRVI